jgi:serine/threonine protein kinase
MPLANTPRIYNPGERVRHYTIVSVIGFGKFGAVYEARAILDPTVCVALKETLHSNSTQIFRREFEALRQMQHPNLPHYYGSFVERKRGYLVMDLVPGQNLHDVLSQQPLLPDGYREPLPESLVMSYAVQLCEALRYLHGQETPILHRDIKPANIRVTPNGLVKLVDFGLLKYAGKETHPDIRGIGTVPYAPPEQYTSSGNYTDQRSDIYSLSATLYHMLTGHEPPPASARIGKRPDPLLPPRYYVPELSPHVCDAIMIGMNLSKQDRYPDITMFKRALLDDSTVNLPRTLRGHSAQVNSVSYSANGQLLASASNDWTVNVWNAPEGRLLYSLNGHSGQVNRVACSPDGRMLASASSASTVRLWCAEDGSAVGMFQGHSNSVRALAWSPDGALLASAGDDRVVQVWRLADSRQCYTLRGHSESVRALAWSPDGALLASASMDRTVRLWQMSTGTLLVVLKGHRDGVRAVAWSPDGQMVASAGYDRMVRLWHASSGQLLYALNGHTGKVNSLAFSPDGRTLASASADESVRLWRVADGELLHALPGHAGELNDIAFNPDGRTFVIAGDDKTIREWMAVTAQARQMAV